LTKLYTNIFSFFFLLIVYSCANVSAPTGGAKDKISPKIENQIPINGTTNFTEKKLRIWFDEYVTVKDLNSEFLSSPPFKKVPKFLLKGKSVEFTIVDTLKESTTYHLNFGNSIVDLNESNPYSNFDIAFSTGDEIDSLQIKGQIFNAFDLKPVENVLLLLYNADNYYDSIPYFDIPDYIGRSNKSGNFEITYFKTGSYKIFALEDLNKNKIFDQTNERIAFIDSIIIPNVSVENIIDTVYLDTLKNDTLKSDSIRIRTINKYLPDSLVMMLFEEEKYQQFISDEKREEKQIFYVIMNDSLTEKTNLIALNFSLEDCYIEYSQYRDSITFYIEDTNTAKIDTLLLEFSYQKLDSLNNLADFTDTLKFIYKEKKLPRQRKNDIKIEEKKKLIDIKYNVKERGRIDLNSKFSFLLSYPVISVDKNKFKLENKIDTIFKSIDFKLINDSINKRKYYVDFIMEENTEYKLFVDTNAFENNFGLTNDTIIYNFISQEQSFYGTLKIILENLNQQVIVQLIKDEKSKEIILDEQIVNDITQFDFSYIKAGDYILKLIYDDNKNNKWDTGKYLENIQPEKVIYYDGIINIKPNWDIEIDWDLLK
jgi:uncharacterized protein (DUF2141 family)